MKVFWICMLIILSLLSTQSEYVYEKSRRDKNLALMPFPRIGKSYDVKRQNLIPFIRVGRTFLDDDYVLVPYDTPRYLREDLARKDDAGTK